MILDTDREADGPEVKRIVEYSLRQTESTRLTLEESETAAKHQQILPIADGRTTFRIVFDTALRTKSALALAVIFSLANAGSGAVMTYLLSPTINSVVDGGGWAATGPLLATLVALALVSAVMAICASAWVGIIGQNILVSLREAVLQRALNLPAARLERAGAGDALSRVADDVNESDAAVRNVLPSVIWCSFAILFSFVGLFALDWRLCLLGLLATPVYALAMRWYLPRSRPLYARERDTLGERATALMGGLHGMATVHAYGVEADQRALIDEKSLIVAGVKVRVARFIGRVPFFFTFGESLGMTLILLGGYYWFGQGTATLGGVTAAAIMFYHLFWPMQFLVWLSDEVQAAGASLSRIVGVMLMPLDPEPRQPATPRDASLEVVGVSHEYLPGRVVVQPVDVTIRPGETVAIVGASGAGKTTLASIIAGTLMPTRGEVRYGGAPLPRMSTVARRRHVAILSQEAHVFRGTLRDDLLLARPAATDVEIEAALRHVLAWEWVSALPDGIDTEVGEKGHRITPEQSQHLALARVVLADPAIIIMDEATADAGGDDGDAVVAAAADGFAGGHVMERAAQAAAAGRTTIIIAHRLVQAAAADRILVMHEGSVVEEGPHEELVTRGGRYAQLWAAWSRA
ncbi:ABC transporter ATP-binding protein [Micrococcales bacterium 31B]|nr:ABC transporter ATP-binding protein [Micrococcales bacterium 31B]